MPALRSSLRRTTAFLIFAGGLAHAAPPALGLPIRCQLGVDCYIQNFFDHDAEPGWRDYTCGPLSYNGHTGTDFRIADLPAMHAGVAVIAAADGIVVSTRDGEPDITVSQRGYTALNGKEAGNGVRIIHDDGWETQYSHLRRGSVVVRPGQNVKAGEVLGLVGLSGNTDFPHVDFTVRKNRKPVDPFAPEASSCGSGSATLWDSALARQLDYQATGLLTSGFAPAGLSQRQAQAGDYKISEITRHSPAIVFWAEIFGLRQGDVLTLKLNDPSGQALAINQSTLHRNNAIGFALAGKQRTQAAWPLGRYLGQVTVHRQEQLIIDETRGVELR